MYDLLSSGHVPGYLSTDGTFENKLLILWQPLHINYPFIVGRMDV